ncbi:glycosyltransferase [Streptomyces sp. NPDC050504]|uniref:glycosyltransferase n=1 Tax=Streptomyces sp. NPDC050504 TaxID=3365618 RepID=UPI0037986291
MRGIARDIRVAELDLAGPGGEEVGSLRPAPGGPPVVSPGRDTQVFALVRLEGRPLGTVLCTVGAGEDPAEVLGAAARARCAGVRAPQDTPGTGAPTGARGTARASHHRPAGHHIRPAGPPQGAPLSPRQGFGKGWGGGRPAAAEEHPPRATAPREGPAPKDAASPAVTVVLATRDHPAPLARALDSLLRQSHPSYELLVVDNNPSTDETRDLVAADYAPHGVRYAREPVPGLAAAHNRGVAEARGALLAFTDDDVIADPHWLTALTRPLADDPRTACVTGLILPARLTTPAQVLLESHGGFAKGFAPRHYDPAAPPPDEPLFPFTAGSFGSGANMAFRADALRAIGGFDPATGTGTAAKGGDDLYAFVRVLTAGHHLRYTPEAIVWHHHRETWQDLENQAYGYGAGLTAYLTAVLARRPALLPALLKGLPRGLAHARAMTAPRTGAAAGAPGEHGVHAYPWPRALSRLERRGMLYGPYGYLKARRALRGTPPPWKDVGKDVRT